MTAIKNWLLPIIILALLAILGWQLTQKPIAPNVIFTTLDGKKISMPELKGKVVLVNFWATDCSGCIAEMPDLIKTYQKYHAKGFEIVAVAMSYDPPAQVLNFTNIKRLPFLVMHDGLGEITQQFGGVNLTPTALIYNKEGERIQRTIGTLDFSALEKLLNKELS